MVKRQLSQQEIDDYFQAAAKGEPSAPEMTSTPFDFRRLDRIPKSQLSVIHFLHEAFVRTLTSSLSVYLRSYVSGNLISVEQLPYADFVDALASPTCIVYLSMDPYEGNALIEINQGLLAPILDRVLGGNGKIKTDLRREITDIEENMLEGFFSIIAYDLIESWKPVVSVNFAVETVETKPQLSTRIGRNEAVVAIAIELRVGESIGMINLAIPSITLKMMRQRFDQQWTVQRAGSRETELAIQKRIAEELIVHVDCALVGSSIRLRDLLNLKAGSVIDFGIAVGSSASILVNDIPKFSGELTLEGGRHAVVVERVESGQLHA